MSGYGLVTSRALTGAKPLECQSPRAYLAGTSSRTRTRRPTIEPLTPSQRAELKSLAHPLKPIFQVGKDGVTTRAVQAVSEAFNTREILKVKVLDSAPEDARATGAALASGIDGAQVVQVIGRTVVLYRPQPEDGEGSP